MGTSFKIKYINFFSTIFFVVIHAFGSNSQTIITVAGNGTDSTILGLQAVETGLYNPTGIFVNDNGDIYICDQSNVTIWKVDAASGFIGREVFDNSNTTVIIYNRWGDEINSIENYDNVNNVWDGKNFFEESLPSGTYFYVIFYNNDNINPKSGWVQIVN